MANLNKAFLMGNLTRDPELRYIPDGTPVCSFGLAVNRSYTTTSGEKKENTLFIEVTVWRKMAETCAEYLKKGRLVMVEGRLEMDTWEGKDGQKRSKIKVIAQNVQFLGGPRQEEKPGTVTPAAETSAREEEEDIPF
ncbi:single-stranded DNA-binding protein [Planctomycetota bacterium]